MAAVKNSGDTTALSLWGSNLCEFVCAVMPGFSNHAAAEYSSIVHLTVV